MSKVALSTALMEAAKTWQKIKEGSSIDGALGQIKGEIKPAVQSLVYAVARRRVLTQWILKKLASKPPKPLLSSLLEVAFAQAVLGEKKPFTVVDQTVRAVKKDPSLANAANFANAVLRKFLREQEALVAEAMKNDEVKFNAPAWWIKKYRLIFGKDADAVLALQQKHPPLVLRVNRRRISPENYLKKLEENGIKDALRVGQDGIVLLSPRPVSDIPGFLDGEVSIQDAGSQLVAQILNPSDGMVVLDACAAPGGKTGHLLEMADVDLTAIEKDPVRAKRIGENLGRLDLKAEVRVADVGDVASWNVEKKLFDRILLDAPCSASGISRRHPDIPWLKDLSDVKSLAKTQAYLLDKMWSILAKKGRLLYAVCSVMPEEGIDQIKEFAASHLDAKLVPFKGAPEGWIRLSPHEDAPDLEFIPWVRDGFFYALFEKI